MKKVNAIPAQEYAAKRDPWLDGLFDGSRWELEPADWKGRYASVRSASSAVKQAAEHRGITATVAIRGTNLYVQAANGTKPVKPAKKATKAVEATKARATRQAAKKVTPIAKKAATARPPRKKAAAPEAVAS